MIPLLKSNFCSLFWPVTPILLAFEYTTLVISDEPYLMFSWRFKNGYRLSIPQLNFKSYHQCGSAYFKIKQGIDAIEVCVNNLWRYQKKMYPIIGLPAVTSNYRPKYVLKSVTGKQIYTPMPRYMGQRPRLTRTLPSLQLPLFSILHNKLQPPF